MGTQYQVINHSTKQLCGFGLDWNPKHGEIKLNSDAHLFLVYLMCDKFRGHHLAVISEGNCWDWGYENVQFREYEDISEVLLKDFKQWKEDNSYWLKKDESASPEVQR